MDVVIKLYVDDLGAKGEGGQLGWFGGDVMFSGVVHVFTPSVGSYLRAYGACAGSF